MIHAAAASLSRGRKGRLKPTLLAREEMYG